MYDQTITQTDPFEHTSFLKKRIAEFEQSEQQLRESETRYRSLASLADRSFVVDRECRFLFANEAYVKLFGLTEAELLCMKYDDIHDEAQSEQFCGSVQQVFDTGKTFQYEFKGKITGNDFLRKLNPIRNDEGTITAVTVISIDITERKKAETELDKYRQHLEELVKERTQDLNDRNISLQELNKALNVLLKKREADKKELEETLVTNLRGLVMPYIEQLLKSSFDARQQTQLEIVAAHLNEITTPLIKQLNQFNLTPQETKVAALVKQGKSTKDIAMIMGLATASVSVHRKNLRKKLRVHDRSINLASYLSNLTQ